MTDGISPDSHFDDRSDEMLLRIFAMRKLRHQKMVSLNAPKTILKQSEDMVAQAERLVEARGLTEEQKKEALSMVGVQEAVLDATHRSYEVTLTFVVTAPYIGNPAEEEAKKRLVPHIVEAITSAHEFDPDIVLGFIDRIDETDE